jgi:Disulphide bond corrector protein DsbC
MRIALVLALLAQLSPAARPRPSHATVTPSPADVTGAAGAKVSLSIDVTPKAGIHVYAPGSQDYIPVEVKLDKLPTITAGKVVYPKSEMMTFGDEKVPVFAKAFRLTQDVTLAKSVKAGDAITVSGTVSLQACDDKVCYPPESAPVSWIVTVK